MSSRSSQARAAALVVLALLAGGSTAAAAPSGFAFLEVPAGARASALAGAFASRADGVEATFWNPAGLASTTKLEIVGSHVEFFQQLRHEQFAFARPLWGGGVAAGLRAMYTEAITERDELGNDVGTFGGHDLEFSLAYGRTVGQGLRAGGSFQVVRERIDESSATTWAMNGGLTWEPVQPLRLSVSGHNLGPSAHYKLDDGLPGEAVPLPAAVQAGASYAVAVGSGFDLRGSLETRLSRGRNAVAMVGAELGHVTGAAVRVGYRANDDATRMGFGVGYAFTALRLDYAYVPGLLDLGDTHRFSFAAAF
jgi:hypothetical protein